jgi:hypothetical protein
LKTRCHVTAMRTAKAVFNLKPSTLNWKLRQKGDPMSTCLYLADSDASPSDDRHPAYVKSVYSDCEEEAARYKWIQSEKAGYDLGEAAIRQWVKEHWTGYLRAKWVEHLQGKCFWIELDRGDFGLLQHEFRDRAQLLDAILERLKAGKENLDVLDWAHSCLIPIDPVIEILTALDVNSRRLFFRFH